MNLEVDFVQHLPFAVLNIATIRRLLLTILNATVFRRFIVSTAVDYSLSTFLEIDTA
jgi:hypothetical protein